MGAALGLANQSVAYESNAVPSTSSCMWLVRVAWATGAGPFFFLEDKLRRIAPFHLTMMKCKVHNMIEIAERESVLDYKGNYNQS